jgi:NAD(P)-dependent dehydrogenase (short-subunit alcohol dehydrogenase family)
VTGGDAGAKHAGPLAGKVALVTGAAQGIGECIARFLARDGAAVMVADLQADKVADVARTLAAEGGTAAAVPVDIAEPARVQPMVDATLKRFGAIDVLVNNAGLDAPPGRAWELDEAHWRRIIDVDLSGAWWCARAVIPHMIARRSGRIIFISSTSARRGSPTTSVAYNAAKAGLIGLTIGLSVQLEPHGIRVNAIAPGPTGTGQPMSPEERVAFLAEYPLGLGGPEPVAHAVLYLARESGDWVSGAVLNVSGGRWRG